MPEIRDTAASLSSTFVPQPAVAGEAAEVLASDGAGGTVWTAASAPGAHASTHSQGGADAIDAADLGSGAATDGYVLTADGAGGAAWEAAAGGGGGATTLDGLTDVATAGAATGEALVYDGSGWVPSAAAAVLTNDSRLTDARTPTAHKTSHATGGPDALTAADIGALATADAAELIRDTIGTALVAGSGVTITPNDGADTITIASSGGSALPAFGTMSYFRPLPGWYITNRDGSTALAADVAYLYWFELDRDWTPAQIDIRVGVAGAGSVYLWFYALDTSWNPTGAAVLDVTASAGYDVSTTGQKSVTGLTTTLPAGRYAAILRSSVAVTLAGVICAITTINGTSGQSMGGIPSKASVTATKAPAASTFASPTYNSSNSQPVNLVHWK